MENLTPLVLRVESILIDGVQTKKGGYFGKGFMPHMGPN
jgi:hypothetical protein